MSLPANISERKWIRFIIDGLDDRTTAVTMMHQAHVLVNFKNLLTDYDRYHPRQAMQPATTSN